MQSVSAHDAKARFGQLLDTALREPVVIERHGRAVAVVLFVDTLRPDPRSPPENGLRKIKPITARIRPING